MTERKWTNENWWVGTGDGVAVLKDHPTEPDNPEVIARISTVTSDEYVAQANLIVAAPDLFEALDDLLDHYTLMVQCGDCGTWDAEREPQVIAARAALAKAEGRTDG